MTTGIHLDDAGLFWMWNETMRTLDGFEELVGRGESLECVQFFAQFVLWSGLCGMFERGSRSDHLKVDGGAVRARCQELESKCRALWAGGRVERQSSDLVEVDAIHRKLDVILRQVSAVTAAEVRSPTGSPLFLDPETHRFLTRREVERQHVVAALNEADWVRTKAARLLGVNTRTVYGKIKEFGLERPELRPVAESG